MRYLFLLFFLSAYTAGNGYAQGLFYYSDSMKAYREVSTSDYHHDTLKLYFNISWKKINPVTGDAMYYTEAYPLGDNWACLDFYLATRALESKGTYKDQALKIKEGPFTTYYQNGKIERYGSYTDNIKEGWWLDYDKKGNITDSVFYIHDMPSGRCIARFSSGALSEIMEMDPEGSGMGREKGFFESGTIEHTGQYSKGFKEDSIWQYFYPNKTIAYEVVYDHGKLVSERCFDTAGHLQGNCTALKMPEFPGGEKKLMHYLSRHIIFPSRFRVAGKIFALFTVDNTGKVGDIEIIKPLPYSYGHKIVKAYNDAVIKALQKMPDWVPAERYNRKVKVYYELPVSFQVE